MSDSNPQHKAPYRQYDLEMSPLDKARLALDEARQAFRNVFMLNISLQSILAPASTFFNVFVFRALIREYEDMPSQILWIVTLTHLLFLVRSIPSANALLNLRKKLSSDEINPEHFESCENLALKIRLGYILEMVLPSIITQIIVRYFLTQQAIEDKDINRLINVELATAPICAVLFYIQGGVVIKKTRRILNEIANKANEIANKDKLTGIRANPNLPGINEDSVYQVPVHQEVADKNKRA